MVDQEHPILEKVLPSFEVEVAIICTCPSFNALISSISENKLPFGKTTIFI